MGLDQYQIRDKNDKLICSGNYFEVVIPWFATIVTDEALEKQFPGLDRNKHKLNFTHEDSPLKLLTIIDTI